MPDGLTFFFYEFRKYCSLRSHEIRRIVFVVLYCMQSLQSLSITSILCSFSLSFFPFPRLTLSIFVSQLVNFRGDFRKKDYYKAEYNGITYDFQGRLRVWYFPFSFFVWFVGLCPSIVRALCVCVCVSARPFVCFYFGFSFLCIARNSIVNRYQKAVSNLSPAFYSFCCVSRHMVSYVWLCSFFLFVLCPQTMRRVCSARCGSSTELH